jgi:hypothetical protein
MAIRKLFTSDNLEMELLWSPKGIHFNFYDVNDSERGLTFVLEPNDVEDFIQDIIGLDNARSKNSESESA